LIEGNEKLKMKNEKFWSGLDGEVGAFLFRVFNPNPLKRVYNREGLDVESEPFLF